jgi:hypothetical protein
VVGGSTLFAVRGVKVKADLKRNIWRARTKEIQDSLVYL